MINVKLLQVFVLSPLLLIFYFVNYFIVFRFFAFTNFNQPRAIVIALFALILSVIIVVIRNFFSKSKTAEPSMKIMLGSAVFAILIGSRLATFGIEWTETSLLARIFNIISGISVAFVFFVILFSCIYNVRNKIFESLKIFADWKLWLVIGIYNLLAVLFVLLGRQVFFWDNAGFWVTSAELSEIIFSNPREFVGRVVYSIFNSDYNYIPAIAPAFIMRIFNTSRLVFILSIVNLYYIPVVVTLYFISKKTAMPFSEGSVAGLCPAERRGFGGRAPIQKKTATPLISFITTLVALPMIPYITVLGFLDVGGVFLIMVILFIFLKLNRSEFDFLGGVLICILTVFRRWYIVFTLAFLLCGFIYSIFTGKFKKYIIMALGFIIPFFLFFQGYLTERLMGRYFADRYFAYRFPIGVDIRLFARHFGLALVIGIVVYIVFALWLYRKSDEENKKATPSLLFLFSLMLVMFFVLTRIQTHGQQHLLLYAAPFSLIILIICNGSKAIFKRRLIKFTMYAIAFSCTISVFIPRTQPRYLAELNTYAIFPSFMVYPTIRADANELLALDEFLRNLDGRTAIMASSFTINPDLIARARASLNPTRPLTPAEHILFLPDVDRRDGRPYDIVYADYILVTNPIQTHLALSEQRVVLFPAQMLLTGTGFAEAFERMDTTFILRDGVRVYIFRRIRPNTEEELQNLMNEIQTREVRYTNGQ